MMLFSGGQIFFNSLQLNMFYLEKMRACSEQKNFKKSIINTKTLKFSIVSPDQKMSFTEYEEKMTKRFKRINSFKLFLQC